MRTESNGSTLAPTTAGLHLITEKDSSIEKSPRRNYERATREQAHVGFEPGNTATFDPKRQSFRHNHCYAALTNKFSHRGTVKPSIGLESRALNGRPFAAVEHPAMDSCPIGSAGHQSIEDVELADKVTLPDAADGRVAGHLPDVLRPKGDQPDAAPATRCSSRGFATGMAAPNYKDVEHGRRLAKNRANRKSS